MIRGIMNASKLSLVQFKGFTIKQNTFVHRSGQFCNKVSSLAVFSTIRRPYGNVFRHGQDLSSVEALTDKDLIVPIDSKLKLLDDIFTPSSKHHGHCILYGHKGGGKTTIALKYAKYGRRKITENQYLVYDRNKGSREDGILYIDIATSTIESMLKDSLTSALDRLTADAIEYKKQTNTSPVLILDNIHVIRFICKEKNGMKVLYEKLVFWRRNSLIRTVIIIDQIMQDWIKFKEFADILDFESLFSEIHLPAMPISEGLAIMKEHANPEVYQACQQSLRRFRDIYLPGREMYSLDFFLLPNLLQELHRVHKELEGQVCTHHQNDR